MQTNLFQNATSVQVLSKTSTENEIKTYFQKVLELKQSGEEFPIDLELVWPLAYSRKDKAVRALKRDFIENDDFLQISENQSLPRNGERSKGQFLGDDKIEYKL